MHTALRALRSVEDSLREAGVLAHDGERGDGDVDADDSDADSGADGDAVADDADADADDDDDDAAFDVDAHVRRCMRAVEDARVRRTADAHETAYAHLQRSLAAQQHATGSASAPASPAQPLASPAAMRSPPAASRTPPAAAAAAVQLPAPDVPLARSVDGCTYEYWWMPRTLTPESVRAHVPLRPSGRRRALSLSHERELVGMVHERQRVQVQLLRATLLERARDLRAYVVGLAEDALAGTGGGARRAADSRARDGLDRTLALLYRVLHACAVSGGRTVPAVARPVPPAR